MTKLQKVKRVKAFAIVNRLGAITNKQAEHFQLYTFREKKPAEYLTWLWNTQSGENKYKVIPVVILIPKK